MHPTARMARMPRANLQRSRPAATQADRLGAMLAAAANADGALTLTDAEVGERGLSGSSRRGRAHALVGRQE